MNAPFHVTMKITIRTHAGRRVGKPRNFPIGFFYGLSYAQHVVTYVVSGNNTNPVYRKRDILVSVVESKISKKLASIRVNGAKRVSKMKIVKQFPRKSNIYIL